MKIDPSRLIVALDTSDPGQARKQVALLAPLGVGFKLGLELFMSGGPALAAELASRHRLFLDLKFHDIPTTVVAALKAAASLGVWMVNIHASGGREMMFAAREALEGLDQRPILIAVTVLTSIDDKALHETGCRSASAADQVKRLALLASACGLDGVVCSPLEITRVREAVCSPFLTVTPGVRPAGSGNNDQARTAEPGTVIRAGGNYLVVGRPITRAAAPETAAESILLEMEAAL